MRRKTWWPRDDHAADCRQEHCQHAVDIFIPHGAEDEDWLGAAQAPKVQRQISIAAYSRRILRSKRVVCDRSALISCSARILPAVRRIPGCISYPVATAPDTGPRSIKQSHGKFKLIRNAARKSASNQ